MTEESTQTTIRLSKVVKEFNIGIGNILEFLAKKGFTVDSNPNAKITAEQYGLLSKEFQSEKSVKEESRRVSLMTPKKEVTPVEEESTKKENEPDLIIKDSNNNAEIVQKPEVETKKKETASPKIIGKIDLVPDKPKKKSKKTEAELAAEKTAEVAEVKKTSKSKKKDNSNVEELVTDENTTQQEDVVKKTDEKPVPEKYIDEPLDHESNIKIIGKLDLSTINSKTKPAKKTKKEKEEERNAKKPVKKVKEASAGDTEKSSDKKNNQKQDIYQTGKVSVGGPTILGKMDLDKTDSQKKPVASSSDEANKRKKRKRIINDHKPFEGDTKSPNQNNQSGQQTGNYKNKNAKYKPELDKDAIDKQIKETLARLSGTGKSKTSKYRKQKRSLFTNQQQEDIEKEQGELKTIKVTEFVTANELATMINAPVNEVISTCLNLGIFVSINQRLDAETLSIVADEFGYKVEFVSVEVQEAIKEEEDNPEDIKERYPIVTVMGHVDHGKTSLLDNIRKTNVIAGEAGGITQHIGAYVVTLENGKKITFLDTPGHEAFTAMRARGAQVTDIAIIVIAADDSVMPQTVEAINHAQAAGVPIVFAINKIDKPNANPDKIREALSAMNILVEEWGGKYQCQEVAAKKGINIDALLVKVLLEAEMLELKGNAKKNAVGTVIESSLDKGKGYVATILVQNGTLRVGDMLLAGCHYGRVKALYNERGAVVTEAGPSTPVLVLGLNGAPQAGDKFNVMSNEQEVKNIAVKRLQLQREQGLRTQKHITLDEIGRRIAIGDFKELNVIVKGDVDGSVEALTDSILKLSSAEVQVNVIHKSVGQITESDVLLASASNAVIIGFQVRPSSYARKLAEQEQIDIRLYSVIYNAINELTLAIEGMLSPDIEEKIICNIEVREVFNITKVGNVAGCYVLDGKMYRTTKIRLIRNGIVIYSGALGSLKRFKDDVKEISSGYECGLNIANFDDIKVGDIIEGYEEIEVKRKL